MDAQTPQEVVQLVRVPRLALLGQALELRLDVVDHARVDELAKLRLKQGSERKGSGRKGSTKGQPGARNLGARLPQDARVLPKKI